MVCVGAKCDDQSSSIDRFLRTAPRVCVVLLLGMALPGLLAFCLGMEVSIGSWGTLRGRAKFIPCVTALPQ